MSKVDETSGKNELVSSSNNETYYSPAYCSDLKEIISWRYCPIYLGEICNENCPFYVDLSYRV